MSRNPSPAFSFSEEVFSGERASFPPPLALLGYLLFRLLVPTSRKPHIYQKSGPISLVHKLPLLLVLPPMELERFRLQSSEIYHQHKLGQGAHDVRSCKTAFQPRQRAHARMPPLKSLG